MLYIVDELVAQAMKLSCLGLVVIMVSPSKPQSVVVAAVPKVRAWYEAVPVVFRFK
jgi:hypothetical protein